MNEAVLCDEEDYAVAWRYLHGDRKIIGGYRRKEHIDCLFLEWWVCWIMINFNDMQLFVRLSYLEIYLCASSVSDGECEQLCFSWRAF